MTTAEISPSRRSQLSARWDGFSRILLARAARAEKARRSLFEFLKQGWHVLEPGVTLDEGWHIEAVCLHVQWMLEGWLVANGYGTAEMKARVCAQFAAHGLTWKQGQLLVQNFLANVPPGTLKSRILMVFAPAWMWLHCPSWSLCAISSVDDNVTRDSNAHRELVASAWYRATFSIEWTIKKKADSVGDWQTTAGGERKSRPLLAGFTGVHVDALLLDDPDDAHRVFSEPERKKVQNKWTRAIKNRVKSLDRSIRIAIQQRVHVDDWTAYSLRNGRWSRDRRLAWAQLCLPLLAGHGPKDLAPTTPWGWSDPRTIAGECLQPSRFSEEAIADERIDRGPYGFESQYNQNPEPLDNGMIKHAWLRFFRLEDTPANPRRRPDGCRTVEEDPTYTLLTRKDGGLDLDWLTITVDCSNGSEALTASAVGLLAIGGKGQQRFAFDDRTAVMGILEMYAAVRGIIEAWPVGRVLIELKAAGSSVIADLKQALAKGDLIGPDGRPCVVVVEAITDVKDSKESRAAAMVPAFAAGLVYVLEGAPWLYPTFRDGKLIDTGFVGEVCVFPQSKRNDRIDALSQLMTRYRGQVSSDQRLKQASRALARAVRRR